MPLDSRGISPTRQPARTPSPPAHGRLLAWRPGLVANRLAGVELPGLAVLAADVARDPEVADLRRRAVGAVALPLELLGDHGGPGRSSPLERQDVDVEARELE